MAVKKATMPLRTMEGLRDKHGDHCISTGNFHKPDPFRIPTGIFPVDYITGGGPVPLWQSACYWGADKCLSGDSRIKYQTRNKKGIRHDVKGGTIKRLYERFNKIPNLGKGKYQRKESINADFYAPSVKPNGVVFQNKIIGVVKCGRKEIWEVITKKGFSLRTTLEHKFMVGKKEFKPLGELSVGDSIYIHTCRGAGKSKPKYKPELLIKYHPSKRIKVIDGKYVYCRVRISRLAYEAHMNGLSYEEYVKVLNTGSPEDIDKFYTVPQDIDVHHKDGDNRNDVFSNMILLSRVDHMKLHCDKDPDRMRYRAYPDKIVSIEYHGEEETYDLQMKSPNNNYVANHIVVHNSGKSSLAGDIIRESQNICWRCFKHKDRCVCSLSKLLQKAAYGNVENTLNTGWYASMGVDIDSMYVLEASTGEEFGDIFKNVLQVDDIGLLVVDSIAALVPDAEMEVSLATDFYALQSKLIGPMIRQLKQTLIREKHREHPCAILFVNQMRTDLTIKFGSNEKMSGGFQMMHEFSMLLRVARLALGQTDKNKFAPNEVEDQPMAVRHGISIKSNKVMTLATACEYVRAKRTFEDHGIGMGCVDDTSALVTYAKRHDLIKKDGTTWMYFDRPAKNLKNIETMLRENPSEKSRLQEEIIAIAKGKAIKGESYARSEVCGMPPEVDDKKKGVEVS